MVNKFLLKNKRWHWSWRATLFWMGLFFLLGAVFFYFSKKDKALAKEDTDRLEIILSEIMFNPEGRSEKGKEWVEIYFPKKTSLKALDKEDGKFIFPLEVCYKAKKEGDEIECEKFSEVYFDKNELEISKGEFIIIAQDKEKFCKEFFGNDSDDEENKEEKACQSGKKGKILESEFTLYNSSSNFVGVYQILDDEDKGFDADKKDNDGDGDDGDDEKGEKNKKDSKEDEKETNNKDDDSGDKKILLNHLFYKNSWSNEGHSLEKKDLKDGNEKANWVESAKKGGTPFSFFEKKKYSSEIFLNEIIPNPEGIDSKNEWVELFNFSDEKIDLTGWWIENSNGKRFYLESAQINPGNFYVIAISLSSFSIRNRNGDRISLLNPNGEIVDSVSWKESAPSGASYSRRGKGQWEWSQFLTSGRENQFNSLPQIRPKVDEKVYRGLPAVFDASKTSDQDGEELKFIWDFGDGKRSYKKKTSHAYDKKGEYNVKLIVKDSVATVEKVFKVKVRSYSKIKLKIVELEPNPEGNDKGKERLVIKNKSSKKINLKQFIVATGKSSSKVVNHPIYDNFWIRPGKERTLTNKKICYFSLLNSKGTIKLLYPDKKEADKVKYEKEKIEEGEFYHLTEEGWAWTKTNENDSLAEGGFEANNDKSFLITGKEEQPVSAQPTISLRKIFILGAMSKKEKICQTSRKIRINNWKKDNSLWLKLVKECLDKGCF